MQPTLALISAKLRNNTPKLDGIKHSFAVLVPLININGEIQVLYQVRAGTLRWQPGEVCFPGGRIEQGESASQAAVREACEELGTQHDRIEIMARLSDIVTPYGYLIKSFVAEYRGTPHTLTPNPQEVEELFLVPLAFFLTTEPQVYFADVITRPGSDFPFNLIPQGEAYPWRRGQYPVYFYQYQGRVIWGITARISKHLAVAIS